MEQQEDTRPVHLYFNRNLGALSDLPQELIDAMSLAPKNIICCHSWSELGDLMKLKPTTICVHATELEHTSAVETVNMIKTLAKLVNNDSDISISVGVNKTTTHDEIKEFQKSDINCIIPHYKDFGINECMKGLHAQWHSIPYWPKHIVSQLPGAKPAKEINNKDIKLTARQNQILNLVLERGASNKIIARTLNIGESTVKLHLGHIFKKYGVKNRTQLAVFARK